MTYTADEKGRGQWCMFVNALPWATTATQLTYIKGYVTASRSNIVNIVASNPVCFTVTGDANSKQYTFTNAQQYAYELIVDEIVM